MRVTGLDRIDHTIGYHFDNVRPSCEGLTKVKKVKKIIIDYCAKHNMTIAEFRKEFEYATIREAFGLND